MATYTIRGTSHNIVYTYKTIDGKRKQQWESYSSELEAIQRKAYIDYLQDTVHPVRLLRKAVHHRDGEEYDAADDNKAQARPQADKAVAQRDIGRQVARHVVQHPPADDGQSDGQNDH